jgi:hypothetical protein
MFTLVINGQSQELCGQSRYLIATPRISLPYIIVYMLIFRVLEMKQIERVLKLVVANSPRI